MAEHFVEGQRFSAGTASCFKIGLSEPRRDDDEVEWWISDQVLDWSVREIVFNPRSRIAVSQGASGPDDVNEVVAEYHVDLATEKATSANQQTTPPRHNVPPLCLVRLTIYLWRQRQPAGPSYEDRLYRTQLDPTMPGQVVAEHTILVFGHTRPEALQFVLEGLARQDSLANTQVWLDGHQEFPDLLPLVEACQALEGYYPAAQWFKYGRRCGFVKLFMDAVLLNCSRYKRLIILDDDCYPAESAVDALLSALREVESDPRIFSVYGHHFGTADEGLETTAFQCWGWATSADKLRPVVDEFLRLWTMPEPHALAWFQQNMTPEIRARMDVFPGRSESKLLEKWFCFDAVMAFLIAREGMSNRRTQEQVIYNFGIGERSGHFTTFADTYLKPPFNMVTKRDLIERFGLHGLPDDHELTARSGTEGAALLTHGQKGAYEIRGVAVDGWLTPDARVLIKSPEAAGQLMLTLQVPRWLPFDYPAKLQTIRNGHVEQTFEFAGPGKHEIRISLARSGTVSLRIDKWFVPAQLGTGSSDARQLAYRLKRISPV